MLKKYMGSIKISKVLLTELRSALSTLFPKHGDQAKIIRCEIISTEEAKKQCEDAKPKDLFEKADCEDGYCPLPTQQVS